MDRKELIVWTVGNRLTIEYAEGDDFAELTNDSGDGVSLMQEEIDRLIEVLQELKKEVQKIEKSDLICIPDSKGFRV